MWAVSALKAFQGSEGVAGSNEREKCFLRGVIDFPSRHTNEGPTEAGRLPCTDLGLDFRDGSKEVVFVSSPGRNGVGSDETRHRKSETND